MQKEQVGLLLATAGLMTWTYFRKQIILKENIKSTNEQKVLVKDNEMAQRKPRVVIRFCTKCKWTLRASWMATEILQTFSEDVELVSLEPSVPGTYQIVVISEENEEEVVVWDRRVDNGFPYPKDVKIRMKKLVFFEKSLGKCVESK